MTARISLATLREAAKSYAVQIAAKCKAEKCEVGVLVVIVPREDPRPQWSGNMAAPTTLEVLRKVSDEVAHGIVVVPPEGLS